MEHIFVFGSACLRYGDTINSSECDGIMLRLYLSHKLHFMNNNM
jgi:hypothetical protein